MAVSNRSLERGLAILDCFKPGIGVLSHRDLVEQTLLPKATLTRLVRTLCEQGYLVLDRNRGGYRLGVPVLSLARALTLENELLEAVSPVIHHIAERTRAMVGFGTAHGTDIVYLQGVNRDVTRPSRRIGPGMRIPILGSSIGHAWLAGLTHAQRTATVARLLRMTPSRPPGARAAVDAAVREMRERGHCSVPYNEGRHLAVGASVVVPGEGVYAFNVVYPVRDYKAGTVPKVITGALRELMESARRLTS